MLVLVPAFVYAGFLSKVSQLTSITVEGSVLNKLRDAEHDLAMVALLSAARNPAAFSATGGGGVVFDDGALLSSGPVGEEAIAAASIGRAGEISVYVVREGDSLSQIAEMFNVTVNTIIWANDLKSASDIRPGQTLVILPVAGVKHLIKEGDTIDSIVKKYEADQQEVLAYNNLNEGDDLVVGEELIIPGGTIAAPAPAVPKPTSVSSSASASTSGLSHPLPGSVRTQGIHGYNAVDFGASVGAPIRAAASGEVIVARASGWNGGYGNYVVISHGNGLQTLYSHMSTVEVVAGSQVSAGQVIGAVGSTGLSTGPHLHFEVRGGPNPF